jgi:hypothetical protein
LQRGKFRLQPLGVVGPGHGLNRGCGSSPMLRRCGAASSLRWRNAEHERDRQGDQQDRRPPNAPN